MKMLRHLALSFTALVAFGAAVFAQSEDPTATGAVARRTGIANPDISVNTLFLYRNSNRGGSPLAAEPNGISLQESELQIFSDVDPYFKLSALFSLHQEFDSTTSERSWIFEPEELFADTLTVPGVTIRFGKFKAAFGRHNLLHTHAYPFIDAPLMNTALLGEEGINDVGVSGSVLLPAPWFSELTLQVLNGKYEGSETFLSRSPNDSLAVGHLKNLWDLSDDLTAELGLSGAFSKYEAEVSNVTYNGDTWFYGLDFTMKWRPSVGGKYRAISWSTELISREIKRKDAALGEGQGYASWLQVQFAQRWWAQARAEYLKLVDDGPAPESTFASVAPLAAAPASEPALPHQRKYTALVAFAPSEFSSLRLQYDHLDDGTEKPEQRVMLQGNFTIGAHPAHAY